MNLSWLNHKTVGENHDISPQCNCINYSGYFISLDPDFQSWLGFRKDQLLNTPFYDFVLNEDRDRLFEFFSLVLGRASRFSDYFRFVNQNGFIRNFKIQMERSQNGQYFEMKTVASTDKL